MTSDPIQHLEPGEPVVPSSAALLALGELAVHLHLTTALASAHEVSTTLRIAPISAGHLRRAQALRTAIGNGEGDLDILARSWAPVIDRLIGSPKASDWLEGLVGAAVAGGVLADLAGLCGIPASEPNLAVPDSGDAGHGDALTATVRGATEVDPTLAGRLSLFGRRTFGQVLIAGRDICARLGAGTERVRVEQYFERAGEAFAARMEAMGLRG